MTRRRKTTRRAIPVNKQNVADLYHQDLAACEPMSAEREREEAAAMTAVIERLETIADDHPERPDLERELARMRRRFVRANLRLVVKLAAQHHDGRVPLADLIQEGNLGLLRAIEKFDPARGFRFCTYAAWWIRHRIGRHLANHGRAVRVPANLAQLASKLRRLTRSFEARHDHSPRIEELAEMADVTPTRARVALEATNQMLSLDAPTGTEDERTLVDTLQDDRPSATAELVSSRLRAEIERALDALPPIEADILRKRFAFGVDEEMTLRELGNDHDLSRERIRQLQNRALARLRETLSHRSGEAGVTIAAHATRRGAA